MSNDRLLRELHLEHNDRMAAVRAERDKARAELAEARAALARLRAISGRCIGAAEIATAFASQMMAERDWLLEYGAGWLQDREGYALAKRQEDEMEACRAQILGEMAEALKAKGVAS